MMRKPKATRSVTCVRNEGCEASLQLPKIYQVAPDARAGRRRLVGIIDESGRDYLHPKAFFFPLELPKAAEKAFPVAG